MNQEELERKIKGEMLDNLSGWLRQLYGEREKTITLVSGLSIAFLGVGLALSNKIKNEVMAVIAIVILLVVHLVGLWWFIHRTSTAIKEVQDKIEGLPDLDLTKPIRPKSYKTDYDIEILSVLYIIGVLLFFASFLSC